MRFPSIEGYWKVLIFVAFVVYNAAVVALSWEFSRMTEQLLAAREESEQLRRDNLFLARAQARVLKSNDAGLELGRYREENRKLGRPAPGEKRLVLIGDSITEGWDIKAYFTGPAYRPINRGIGGQTTAQMLGRFEEDVLALKPQAVLITGGTNDILRNVKPAVTIANISAMIQTARDERIRVFMGAIPPMDPAADSPSGAARSLSPGHKNAAVCRVNAWLRQYCGAGQCVFVDFHQALRGSKGSFDQRNFKEWLHPNERGYKAMAAVLKNAL